MQLGRQCGYEMGAQPNGKSGYARANTNNISRRLVADGIGIAPLNLPDGRLVE